MFRRPPSSPLFPYTPLFRSLWFSTRLFGGLRAALNEVFDTEENRPWLIAKGVDLGMVFTTAALLVVNTIPRDRKSTRLNSSHVRISHAAFCLKYNTDTRVEL